MARIKIPADVRDKAKEIAAKKWFKSKAPQRKAWFSAIDDCINHLEGFSGGEKAENKSIAAMLAVAVHTEYSLADHVVDKVGASVSDHDAWMKMCTAAAWVIVQEYRNDVEKGAWPV
ncbi:hypothetical protein [Paenarthrobacter sp. JL.01a]|uniref:hypothetical protein n=1 Tax=Paenarthrobacter sp. JL.01a TaxID=2979324 RepID=UPI0021C957AA|nr:hypothetical protein [Paenarthrobacter sp. JL.01a]UXM91111.1 hypothetical protein N5P29_17710 [Paenarthrobacter sp. JL.01a]